MRNTVPTSPSCANCGRQAYQVGRSRSCCTPDTFAATQVNVPTSPVFTPAMIAALLSDAEQAHAAFVYTLPVDQRQAENARWATFYGAYMAPRLDASIREATFSPVPTLDAPPFAPADVTRDWTVDTMLSLGKAGATDDPRTWSTDRLAEYLEPVYGNRHDTFREEEKTAVLSRQDGNELRMTERSVEETIDA